MVEPQILRLHPDADLRGELEHRAREQRASCAVASAVGSLTVAVLRFAGADNNTIVDGPLEVLSLSGIICPDGAHLHALVADRDGRVIGGHVASGCRVATTVELALLPVTGMALARRHDPETGYRELVSDAPG
jgi:predicted DNA-binding protein with PD1-like motif